MRALSRLSYIMRVSTAKVYAAKFGLRTVAAVFKKGSNDLSKPIGKRAKSVIGVDETAVPKTNALTGLLYAKYNEIPKPKGNKLSPNWKPAYLEILERSTDSDELIKQLWEDSTSITNNLMTKLSKRLRQTISTQGAACLKCGKTDDVQMHHVKATKRIRVKDRLERHIRMTNILQVPLCRAHHLESHQGN